MLYELLRRTVAQQGDHTAIVDEDGTRRSYREILADADALSDELYAAGVRSGDHVVIILANTPEFVAAVFAIARLGGIAVPLNPAYRTAELRYYLRESHAAALVTDAARADEYARLQKELAQPQRIIAGDRCTWNATGAAVVGAVPGDAPALCQYSSGSTGMPKPIVRTHAQLLAEAEQFVTTVELRPDEPILAVAPLFHAHGLGNCLLAAVRAGASLVLLRAFHRRRTIASIIDHRVSLFPGVPFMFGILASSHSIAPQRLPHLRLAFSAGAPLPRDVFQGFSAKFGVTLRQLYGSTETGSISINLGSCAEHRWASVGQPMRGIDVRVVDPWGRAVAPGERGELLVRSAAMTTGYRGLEEAAARAFRDGYYWTSDLGYQDNEGNLYVTGRTTIFIDTGGHKVDPVEVEQVLDRHPKVAQSVVIGAKGRYGRQVLKAVLVAREPCTAEEIALWCQSHLADFKIPRIIEFRREIPMSPLGKILRKYLAGIE